MRTLGLIGGMSWESTAIYYELLNRGVKARLGGHHSAKLLLHSVDFAEIERMQRAGAWDEAGDMLAAAARALEGAGAQAIVLCANTMHLVAPAIERAVAIPFLHIVDPTARAIRAAGLTRVGLLATRFTMEETFYVGRLREPHGIEAIVPDAEGRALVHRVIYDELVHGRVLDDSRADYVRVIDQLAKRGAQGVILGCTEVGMLVKPEAVALPCFDTAALHAEAAIDFALA
ncbi:MAG TPA: aspartate/glutamate racemase family protein [Myxococcota bacterium]|nr:aspartate/glutamate racemase family protein [Myxococcota bacterium]